MSANIIPTHQVEQYNSNLELKVQQKGSRFRGALREMTAVGSQMAPVDHIGVIEATEVTTRFAPIVRTDAPTDRRWVTPRDFSIAQQLDQFDLLRLINRPQGALMETASHAIGRRWDDVIIDAFHSAALTGTRGGTSTSLPAGQTVAVNFRASQDVGITVAKIIEAKRILMTNEVDVETDSLYIALDAIQMAKLLNEVPIIHRDYNSSPALDGDGMIRKWLGFTFIHSERINVDSNSDLEVPAWAKSGMCFCTWNGMYTKVSQRDDLESQPWQVYSRSTFGATRIEEKMVVKLLCDPNTST